MLSSDNLHQISFVKGSILLTVHDNNTEVPSIAVTSLDGESDKSALSALNL